MFQDIYASLGRRDAMLLLSSIFFASQEAGELFDLLPDELGEKMRQLAAKFLELPKEKRVPLVGREVKRLMSFKQSPRVDGVDPSWLAAGFRGERPRVVALTLLHMPSSIAHQIVDRLPPQVRKEMPPRQSLTGVPIEIVQLVRSLYDAKFTLMDVPKQLDAFGFREIVALDARELIQLTRNLGLEELACAFVSVGKRALAELLRRMPREHAEELIVAVKKVTRRDAMELKAAQKFLARVLVNFENTDELFQKAGLYQLAKGILFEDREFTRQVCQRFPRAHGRLVEEYIAKAKEFGEWDEAKTHELQDRILAHVVDLSRRGKISTRYAGLTLRWHDPARGEESEQAE